VNSRDGKVRVFSESPKDMNFGKPKGIHSTKSKIKANILSLGTLKSFILKKMNEEL